MWRTIAIVSRQAARQTAIQPAFRPAGPAAGPARWFSQTAVAEKKKIKRIGGTAKRLRAKHRANLNELAHALKAERRYDCDPVFGKEEASFLPRIIAQVKELGTYSHGYSRAEVEKLLYGAQKAALERLERDPNAEDSSVRKLILDQEAKKREVLERILTMRNANKEHELKSAVNLTVKEFSRFEGDTGSSEVQAAVLTTRIHYLGEHVREHKHDFHNLRQFRMMVQKRQKLLRYLKRDDPERYFHTIARLGLTDRAVSMEFPLDRQYMDEFQFYGPDKLFNTKKARNLKDKIKKLRKSKAAKKMKVKL